MFTILWILKINGQYKYKCVYYNLRTIFVVVVDICYIFILALGTLNYTQWHQIWTN